MIGRRVFVVGAGALVFAACAVVVAAGAIVSGGLGYGFGERSPWELPFASLLIAAMGSVAIAAAAALLAARRPRLAAALATLAVVGASPVFERWSVADAALAALPAALAPLVVPALLAAATSDRASARWRVIRAVAWTACAAIGLLVLVLRRPFLDPLCTGACGESPYVVAALPGAIAALRWWMAVVCVAALVVVAVALVVPLRARGWPAIATWAGAGALAVTAFAFATDALWAASVTPSRVDAAVLWAVSLLVLGVAHTAAATVTAARRAAVAELADELTVEASAAASLTARLRAALRDGDARILFPRAAAGGAAMIDADGLPGRAPIDGEVATSVRRGAETVAIIVHSRSVSGDDVVDALGPAARLALSNASTRAGIRASIEELTASRARLVEEGDRIRRGIERDLHDGVQQTLLVLQYELSLAAGQSASGRRARIERVRDGVQAITERTRAIGHGIFPMVLDDLGLQAALDRLADDAPVPFQGTVQLAARPPRPVERAAYLVARDAASAPSGDPDAGPVRVRVQAAGGSVVLLVDGRPPSAVSRDRIDALGGTVDVHGGLTEVTLPCAWS